MTEIQKKWLVRIAIGGAVGELVTAALAVLLNGTFGPYTLVSATVLEYFGSFTLGAAAELCAGFALGAALGVSTLPFDQVGRALAVRSVLHFFITGSFVLLLGWAFRWFDSGSGSVRLVLGTYLFVYLVMWLVRWLGWRVELDELRSALHLEVPPSSALHWRESIPYGVLLAAFFLLLRPLAEVLDAYDVPLLRALLLPWAAYPFVALVSGWFSGRARGFCPLVPLTAFFAFLPNLLWSTVPYDWEQGMVYAALALTANVLGALWRRRKGGNDG